MTKRVSNEELSAYLDGEAAQRHEVAYALRENPETNSRLQQYAALSQQLKSLPEPAVRPDFAGNVIRAIYASKERRATSWWSSVMAPLATAAAFILFAGVAAFGIAGTSPNGSVFAPNSIAKNTPVVQSGLASVVAATYAEEAGDASSESDSGWLFNERPSVEVQPAVAKADQIITALAEVKYFDRPVSPPLESGSDIRATLTGMNDHTQRTFVRLLNDYAYEGE